MDTGCDVMITSILVLILFFFKREGERANIKHAGKKRKQMD